MVEVHPADPEVDDQQANAWPRHVRWLAVAYTLSRLIGPAGFFLLSLFATLLWVRRGLRFDALVTGVWLAALACPLACAAFRGWFRSWGRRHWPEA